ncbi:MAG: WYL domain-containing transcriptional regulator [Merismopedia sp. SIO2A8]|nr:WYL domain-containing transcriptional regulator [Merismopedia sp. SIO2A8]
MFRRLERFLQFDELLRSSQRYTLQSLAEALECSQRTVQYDIDFLRDRFDAPIAETRERGWHYTDADWRLDTVPLTQGEVFALTLGARMFAAYGGSAYAEELESALEQLCQRLPTETQVKLRQVRGEKVLFHIGAALVNLNPDVWQRLEFATQMEQSVRMEYFTASRNELSERVLDPYVLYIKRSNPYVTGFCHSNQDIRDFRIDRVRWVEVLPDAFEMVPGFGRRAYVDVPFFHERGGEPQRVVVEFDGRCAPYIKERQWHESQSMRELDNGWLRFEVETRSLAEVKRWVLGFGAGAIVREPPELVKMVRSELERMSKQYKEARGE